MYPILVKLYLAAGTALWSMQVSDCHWFKLNESPTNIILFPLSLDNKYRPLNLHEQIKRGPIKIDVHD